MNTSYRVKIYTTRVRKDTKSNPYNVRWRVAEKRFSESFRTMGLARSFHGKLTSAANDGEAFDTTTGLPVSLARKQHEQARANAVKWMPATRAYVDHKWKISSGNRRRTIAEVLTDVTCVLLPGSEDRPAEVDLRRALFRYAFNTQRRDADDMEETTREALKWAEEQAPPLAGLTELAVLRDLLYRLALRQDGKPAAAAYFSKRRRVLYNFLAYAVGRKWLTSIPLDDSDLKWERPSDFEVEDAIDPRSVGNVEQVERMLTAVSYVGRTQGPRFVAFFGCVFYAMARPEEVVDLRAEQCELPKEGWGRLLFAGAAPAPGIGWTDSGAAHELRALKHRSRKTVRPVPIPPRLVALLREHIKTFGVAPDGRIFRTVTGRRIVKSTWWRVWNRAREYGMSPADRSSQLLRWTYLLRASGVSSRLYAGVPDRQVAEWAGHSVEVLQRIYSRILEGFDTKWNAKMDEVYEATTAS